MRLGPGMAGRQELLTRKIFRKDLHSLLASGADCGVHKSGPQDSVEPIKEIFEII